MTHSDRPRRRRIIDGVRVLLWPAPFLLAWSLGMAQIQLAASDVKAPPGSKVLIPVTLSEGKDVAGLQFTLGFDSALVSVPEGKVPVRGDLLTDHSISTSGQAGQLAVTVLSGSLARLKGGSGQVAGVILQVAATAARGTATAVRLLSAQASDTQGNSIPLGVRNGSILITDDLDLPSEGANELLFPQIVNGSAPGVTFTTTLIFANRTGATTTAEARFFKSDGSPLEIRLTDNRIGSRFTFTLKEGASVFLKTDGSGALSAGYARIWATAPLGGTILFTQLDGGKQTVAEAGVGASPLGSRFVIPLLYERGAADTGIAFANIARQSIDLELRLRDVTGAEVESQKITLAAGRHRPQFASEYFNSLSARPDFVGSIEVIATAPLTAVALKVRGGLITTFPVIGPQYVPAAAGR